MKPYTLTFRRRGTNLLLQAKVYSDSLSGATMALLMWEGETCDIITGQED